MALTKPFTGILPAMQVPFRKDLSIDEVELTRFARWLASHDGIGGLVTNGHTGEVFALSPKERAEVTEIVVKAVNGKVPVVSAICTESIDEACEHARMLSDVGASGVMLMPPHFWLRFGMEPSHVIDYFSAVGEAAQLNVVVHVYPAWTKASYTEQVLHDLAALPWVTTFKLGTREMSKYDRDIRAIRAGDPNATILTCHDEYLLTSMVQGVDGALVGFASFIPELITGLYAAVTRGDLHEAQAIQKRINGLKEVVYASGEPSGDAHARMKLAMNMAGRLNSTVVRPPTRLPEGAHLDRIREAVIEAGLLHREAAE